MASLGEVVDSNLRGFALFVRRHRVGVYGTIIFHLLIAISFLIIKINTINSLNVSLVEVDFEKEQADPVVEKQKIEKEIAELKQAIALAGQNELRNASADVSKESKGDKPALQDDRNTEAGKLYDEARQLQLRLEAGKANLAKLEKSDDGVLESKGQEPTQRSGKVANPGKVLVNYDLGGRKAFRLPVPAYTCEGGGEVKVIIEISNEGYVVSAKVDSKSSNADDCLWNSALRSARQSRFQIMDKPASNQVSGYILYRFIPQ